MVCPDTAYAALAAVAGPRKLAMAFASHAGYRLLFPAGPLIVATGLAVDSAGLLLPGLALLLPVWLSGELWARYRSGPQQECASAVVPVRTLRLALPLLRALLPLLVLGVLLLLGGLLQAAGTPLLDFLGRPKGALLAAATLAVWLTPAARRRECLDAAISRSAALLLIIGAASAFGTMLTAALPIAAWLPDTASGGALLLGLFTVTAACKIAYGSSTATLATATPLLAPLVHAAAISPTAAVFAICLGSLPIMPTDSFYWLVRSDALAAAKERSAILTLAGGGALQAAVGGLALSLLVMLALV